MAHATSPIGPNLFSQLPVSGVAINRLVAERLAAMPVAGIADRLQTFLSHLLTVVLLSVSVFGFYQIATLLSPAHNQQAAPTAKAATPVTKQQPNSLPRSVPTSVSIESIGVAANVISVGQNSGGSIEVPGPEEVGWYDLGPTPGEIGPAVLVGHVDYVTVGPAVFWNLRNMRPNDTIQVTRQDGRTVTFKVEKVASYGQDNFPTDQVYGNIDYPGLRLITCTGDFNYVTHHYSENLVVYARAEL